MTDKINRHIGHGFLAWRHTLVPMLFLWVLLSALPSRGASTITLTRNADFSSLMERGSNSDCMAFNTAGDLYYYGWNHGLEKVEANQLPDGVHQLLLGKSDYGSFFQDPSLVEVKNITGFGIGFDAGQKVISYIKGVYRTTDSDVDIIKIGFTRCHADGSNLVPLVLTAGENFSGLQRVKNAEGGYEEVDVPQGHVFDVGERDPLQMKILDLNGTKTILFTLWGFPAVFQVPIGGGAVTTFYRFEAAYPREMTIVGEDLIVTHKDGDIYRIGLDALREKSDFVTEAQLLDVFGVDSGDICFAELDYEPVSDQIYCVAQVCWNDDIPQTLLAISPDGSRITRVLDENSLTEDLAAIRTPPDGKKLNIQAVAVNPLTVADGTPSLFLGDYWSGLMMVRMDFPPTTHNVVMNCPFGAYLELDAGSGDRLDCYGPFGRTEGPFPEFLLLPQGENSIQVNRDGAAEEYRVYVRPAFDIVSRCKRGMVQLNWTHRPGITRYEIFRSSAADPNNFVKIADTVSTYSVYLDRSVTNETTYLYAVAAVYEDHSEFSNVIAATPSRYRRPGNFDPVIYSRAISDDAWTDATFTYRVLAVDSNGDNLAYSLSGAPTGMTIDADGLIRWTPEAPQVGPITFTVIVTDDQGGDVSQVVSVATKILPSEEFEWVFADPDGGFVGEQTLVTVTTKIKAGADVTPSSLYLIQYGEDFRISNDLGALYDDGTHGDSLAGDGIYTTQVDFFENVKSVLNLRVAAETDGGDTIFSDFFNVSIFEHISDAAFAAILDIHDAATQRFEGHIAQGFDVEQALEETAAWIREQPGVLQANVFLAAFNISITYECGVVGGVSFTQNGTTDDTLGAIRGAGVPDDDAEVVIETSPLISLPDVDKAVGNNRVFIGGSFKFQFDHHKFVTLDSGDETDDIAYMYRNDCRFDVSDFYDDQVTVDVMKTIGDYGIIVLTGHGDAVILSTGETWAFLSKYFTDPPERTGQVGYITGEKPTFQNKIQHELDLLQHRLFVNGKYYMLLPTFVTRYCRFFPNSIVYVGACFSAWNETFLNTFIHNGAKTYIGYSHITWGKFAYPIAMDFFRKLLQENMSVNEAYPGKRCESELFYRKWLQCCTKIYGEKDIYGSTPVLEVDSAVLDGAFSSGQPVDMVITGKHFLEDSRVTVKNTDTGEEITFGSISAIDCETVVVKDAVFFYAGTYDICVENLSGGNWQGQCVPITIGLPRIDEISPNDNIPINTEIPIDMIGIYFSVVQTIVIVDPDGNWNPVAFTLIDDTHIRIPAHTFLSPGEHRIILVSDAGETQESVQVENTPTPRFDALRGYGDIVGFYPECGLDYWRYNTPAPYSGRTSLLINTATPSQSTFSTATCQLPIPAGETLQNSVVDILDIDTEDQATGSDLSPYVMLRMMSTLYYREVISVTGAAYADGSVITTGSVPCHLEISGSASRNGCEEIWITDIINIAVFPDNAVVSDDPYVFSRYEALPPLATAFVHMVAPENLMHRSYDTFFPQGDSLVDSVSESFDLPLGGRVVFYSGYTDDNPEFTNPLNYEVGIQSRFQTITGTHSHHVTYRLVSDDPNVELIYHK